MANDLDDKTRRLRRGDLIISPLMILGGVWLAIDSFLMSRETILSGESTVATSPGLLPIIISSLIVICSVSVLLNAIRSGADLSFLKPSALGPIASKFENWTSLIVMAMFAIYIFVLIGRIPFIAATILFGVSMMLVFKAAKPIWVFVIVGVYSLVVIYSFSELAATQFPLGIFN